MSAESGEAIAQPSAAGDGRGRSLPERWAALEARLAKIPAWMAFAAAGGLVLASMAVLAASPTLYIADAWPDMFLGLESALHWAHGHHPHEDFHTPLGAGYIAVMGIAGSATDFSPHTLIWANITVAAFTGVVMAIVTFRRLNAPFAALISVYWTLFALSPRRIAGGVEHIAFLAVYNKWGFALTAGLWLAAAIAPMRGGRRFALAEAILLGAALCFLFYLKLTFFAAGMAPFLFRALIAKDKQERRTTLLPVFLCMGLIILASIAGGVSLTGYASDILMTARAASGSTLTRLILDIRFNIVLIGINFLACAIHYRAFRGAKAEAAAAAGRRVAMFILLFLMALAVNNQNTSRIIPLLAFPPLILALGGPDRRVDRLRAIRSALVLAPVLYSLWWGAVELRAIGHHYAAARRGDGLAFCSDTDIPLCHVRVADRRTTRLEYGLAWADTRPFYEELYAALDSRVTPRDRIVYFGFFNVLNARYGLEPARFGLLFWHYRRDFNEQARPEADSVFADATLVVMNKVSLPNSHDDGMARIYGGYVREHFTLAAETPHWKIYRRK